jgi:hypothetical protein
MLDDFADLNAAIAQQLQAKAQAAEIKAAKTRLQRTPPGSAQAAEDMARIAEWSARVEWRPVSVAAVFERETCAHCGTVGERFTGWMLEERHRTMRDSRRLRRISAAQANEPAYADLPRRTVVQEASADICPECAPELGFDLDNAETEL